jgi:hypothetical protein
MSDEEYEYDVEGDGSGEGDEESEEGSGEESGEESESEAGSSRKRPREGGAAGLLAANQKLHAEKAALASENEELREQVKRLKAQLDGERPATAAEESALVPAAGGAPAAPPARDLTLKQVVASRGGTPLASVAAPRRFTGVGTFPHAVVVGRRSRCREYEVEARRPTTFAFQLVWRDTGEPAKESDISSEPVQFQIELVYAENGSPVRCSDFGRTVASLTTPAFEGIRLQNLTDGTLSWQFRTCFTSADTKPRYSQFMIKVSPTGGEAIDMPGLTATSVPFTIRSKVSAPK